jgi:acyl-coenzyme A thioesterase PaaI-like protein
MKSVGIHRGDMSTPEQIQAELLEVLRARFGERFHKYLFPPPVFTAMQGEFVELDISRSTLTVRFPILQSYLNPYGAVQGGMITAAVDNTLGPLSIAIAPPNVTRRLEMKYSVPVMPEIGHILVRAVLKDRRDPWLTFEARVSSPDGQKLAFCKAVHYIFENTAGQQHAA